MTGKFSSYSHRIDESKDTEKNPGTPESELARIVRELGGVSRRCRTLGWQEARESYRDALAELTWSVCTSPEAGELDHLYRGDLVAFIGGDEHINIHFEKENAGDDRVYKITHSDQFGCGVLFDEHESTMGRHFIAQGNDDPYFYLRRWELLNSISEYQTHFEGIIAPEREGWLPRICVSQPYVAGGTPSQCDITAALSDYDFYEVSGGAYFSPSRAILLTDAFPRNVRIWKGVPVLFDAIASEPEEEVVAWMRKRLS